MGFTKGEVIDYYTRIAPALLPHLRDRPLTLKRYPERRGGRALLREELPVARPRLGAKASAWREIDYCVCDDLATLVWLANLADLELHPSLSLVDDINRPTVMAFDLDPGPPAGLAECCEVAVLLRDALAQLGLESFAKTSGSKGIQVYVPLNVDEVDYDHGTKRLSQALARHLEGAAPEADRVSAAQGAAPRQGADRLEPERRAQDHRVRLLAACARAADRFHAAGSGPSSTTRRPRCSRLPTCSSASSATATCSRPWSSSSRSCPHL